MAKTRQPIPKTQLELSQETIQPYDSRGKAPVPDTDNRANRRSVANSEVQQLSIGLQDIDIAIEYYFINVIKPSVRQNGVQLAVPVLYGSPERWVSVQRDGYYRDKNGKIQTPLIMYKRSSIEKNRNLGNKLTANNPLHFGVFEKKYSKKNVYDRFSTLQNRIPVKEFYGVIMPDYVDITYECVIFTEYVEQMNKIVEAINFASDSYWGNKDRFQFRAMIDSYTPTVEVVQGQDRVVKTAFNIKLLGYIIPDTINTSIANPNRYFSKAAVSFKMETAGTLEQLDVRASTPAKKASNRVYETPNVTIEQISQGMTAEQIAWIDLKTATLADIVNSGSAIFTNKTIATPPQGFTLDQNDFQVFINGVLVQTGLRTVEQVSSNIEVTFTALTYSLSQADVVILIGKYS